MFDGKAKKLSALRCYDQLSFSGLRLNRKQKSCTRIGFRYTESASIACNARVCGISMKTKNTLTGGEYDYSYSIHYC